MDTGEVFRAEFVIPAVDQQLKKQDEVASRASSTRSEDAPEMTNAPSDITTRPILLESSVRHSAAFTEASRTVSVDSGRDRGASCTSNAETLVNAPTARTVIDRRSDGAGHAGIRVRPCKYSSTSVFYHMTHL